MSFLPPQLIAFMGIVEHKTVNRAAAAVHVTQTAVTQRNPIEIVSYYGNATKQALISLEVVG